MSIFIFYSISYCCLSCVFVCGACTAVWIATAVCYKRWQFVHQNKIVSSRFASLVVTEHFNLLCVAASKAKATVCVRVRVPPLVLALFLPPPPSRRVVVVLFSFLCRRTVIITFNLQKGATHTHTHTLVLAQPHKVKEFHHSIWPDGEMNLTFTAQ